MSRLCIHQWNGMTLTLHPTKRPPRKKASLNKSLPRKKPPVKRPPSKNHTLCKRPPFPHLLPAFAAFPLFTAMFPHRHLSPTSTPIKIAISMRHFPSPFISCTSTYFFLFPPSISKIIRTIRPNNLATSTKGHIHIRFVRIFVRSGD